MIKSGAHRYVDVKSILGGSQVPLTGPVCLCLLLDLRAFPNQNFIDKI